MEGTILSQKEISKIPKVWRKIVEPHKLFQETLVSTLKRGQDVAPLKPFKTEETEHLLQRLTLFFGDEVKKIKENNIVEARKMAFELGGRHVPYGGESRFQPVYWDLFIICFSEKLEKLPQLKSEHVYLLEKFIRQIVIWMREGFGLKNTN